MTVRHQHRHEAAGEGDEVLVQFVVGIHLEVVDQGRFRCPDPGQAHGTQRRVEQGLDLAIRLRQTQRKDVAADLLDPPSPVVLHTLTNAAVVVDLLDDVGEQSTNRQAARLLDPLPDLDADAVGEGQDLFDVLADLQQSASTVARQLRQDAQPQTGQGQPGQDLRPIPGHDHLKPDGARSVAVAAVPIDVAGQKVQQRSAIQRQHPQAEVGTDLRQTGRRFTTKADAILDAAANDPAPQFSFRFALANVAERYTESPGKRLLDGRDELCLFGRRLLDKRHGTLGRPEHDTAVGEDGPNDIGQVG